MSRLLLVLAAVVLGGCLLSVRIVYLSAVNSDFLQHQGELRTLRTETVRASRGHIEDRNGKPLAISSPVKSLWVNPGLYKYREDAGEKLALALGTDMKSLHQRIQARSSRDFYYLKRHLPPEEAEEIMQLGIEGLGLESEYRRFYPAGEVASHLVGFTDIDDQGQEGSELVFNEHLQGESGSRQVLWNRHGQTIRDLALLKAAEKGELLTLAMDLRLQYVVYRELKTAVEHLQAESGSVVVLDAATGELLALANQPAFNPNDRSTMQATRIRNRAVTDVFEPGSTVKPLVMAAALSSGRFTPDSVVDTSPGFLRIGTHSIRDPWNRGQLDMSGIIAHSSQVGITRVALALPPELLTLFLQRSGLGETTGSSLPGEHTGLFPVRSHWKPIELATLAYGHGFSVTPMQLARAYLMLANDGVLLPVSVLKTERRVKGERILDREVVQNIKQMLGSVVNEGTGRAAALQAYSVAGKTGTSRKVGPGGYDDTRHIAFFAGFAPADKPRLVVSVVINESRSSKYSGGDVAAPVFRRILHSTLRLLNVAPNSSRNGRMLLAKAGEG